MTRLARCCLATLVVFLWSFPQPALPEGLISLLERGDVAPSFELKSRSGELVSFNPGGRASVLVFWSAYCKVCTEIIPALNETYELYRDGVNFLSVNVDGEPHVDNVVLFIDDHDILYPVAFDAIVDDFFIAADKYGIIHTPTIFFIGKDKQVIDVLEGDEVKKVKERAEKILRMPASNQN
ncbi:MAG: redoxin domain-containing protein [Deltaproteobacteria bacterium]|nr:redoxin domain-containing protein [Deltaproteobacteria bacterium]NIS76924.1 redoxin domain-containing protein [Deltaproteobacteria bacterium]